MFKISKEYTIREEENKVILFSGKARKIHYFTLNDYNLIKEISELGIEKVVDKFPEEEKIIAKENIMKFIEKLAENNIIVGE